MGITARLNCYSCSMSNELPLTTWRLVLHYTTSLKTDMPIEAAMIRCPSCQEEKDRPAISPARPAVELYFACDFCTDIERRDMTDKDAPRLIETVIAACRHVAGNGALDEPATATCSECIKKLQAKGAALPVREVLPARDARPN